MFDDNNASALIKGSAKSRLSGSKTAEKAAKESKLAKLAATAIKYDRALYLLGRSGIGKTSGIVAYYKSIGLDVVVLNASTTTPEDFTVPFPQKGHAVVETVFAEWMLSDKPYALIIDDIGLAATPDFGNALMEIASDRSWQGVKLTNLKAIAYTDNLPEDNTNRPTRLDEAQVSRAICAVIDVSETGWEVALQAKYADKLDITRLASAINEHRLEGISPRVLDFMLANLTNGAPAEWAIPLSGNSKKELAPGTMETLHSLLGISPIAEAQGPLKRVQQAFDTIVETGGNLIFQGPPGIAKTAFLREQAAKLGWRVESVSGPSLSPEDSVIPFPVDGKLKYILHEMFVRNQDTPWILHISDFTRASLPVLNQFMSLLNERIIGGAHVSNLKVIVADTNPRKDGIGSSSSYTMHPALASRFQISMSVTMEDFDVLNWLVRTYGDPAVLVREWYLEDLNDTARYYANSRVLEVLCRMIKDEESVETLDYAIPVSNTGVVAPVPLHDLKRRINKSIPPRLTWFKQNIDEVFPKLEAAHTREANGEAYGEHELVIRLTMALTNAADAEIIDKIDLIKQLISVMPKQLLQNLILANADRAKFWLPYFSEALTGSKAKKS